jgi:hypothetical protein
MPPCVDFRQEMRFGLELTVAIDLDVDGYD